MPSAGFNRPSVALALVTAAAAIALLLKAPFEAVLISFLFSVAALLVLIEPSPRSSSFVPDGDANPAADKDILVEAMDEPLLIVRDRRVESANAAAVALLGRHIVGHDVRLAIRHPVATEHLGRALEDVRPVELAGLGGPDERWEMRVNPIADGRRAVRLIDRSASHAAEQMRVDFVANASHELRTPLASIVGFAETLRDEESGPPPETRSRFLGIISDEAKRLQALVEDLLSLSRIEANRYQVPTEVVPLTAIVDEVASVVRGQFGARGADLVIAEGEPVPPVLGDRGQLSQLIHNIVANALKYGRSGTPVTIALTPERHAVRLTVTDQGEGIAAEHIPRLTQRFYRVDAGRSRSMGGTGLGLAIVKHIVERHKGKLEIQSIVGEGTSVSVLLPTAREPLS